MAGWPAGRPLLKVVKRHESSKPSFPWRQRMDDTAAGNLLLDEAEIRPQISSVGRSSRAGGENRSPLARCLRPAVSPFSVLSPAGSLFRCKELAGWGFLRERTRGTNTLVCATTVGLLISVTHRILVGLLLPWMRHLKYSLKRNFLSITADIKPPPCPFVRPAHAANELVETLSTGGQVRSPLWPEGERAHPPAAFYVPPFRTVFCANTFFRLFLKLSWR